MSFSFRIFIFNFCFSLINIQITSGHIRKGQHVWISFRKIFSSGNHEQSLILVQQHLRAFTQSPGGMKSQLSLNLFYCTLPAVTEPWGKLRSAIFAQIAVL